MRPPLHRAVATLLAPIAPVPLCILLLMAFPLASPAARGLAALAAPLACCVGIVLAWRFRRLDAALALALTLAASLLLGRLAPRGAVESDAAMVGLAGLGLVLPLQFLILSLFPERGLASPSGLARLTTLALPALAVTFLASAGFGFYSHTAEHIRAGTLAALTACPLPSQIFAGLRLSQLALFAHMLCAVILGARALLRDSPLDAAFMGLVFASLAALQTVCNPLLRDALLAAGACGVLVGLSQHAYRMAFLDELTGISGRRALMADLRRVSGAYTVAMVDIDHFKKFNDTWGHDIGDQVLRMVATRLSRVRGGGKAYRYGGEEFTLLFPRKELKAALPFLDEVREAVGNEGFAIRSGDRPGKKPRKGGKDSGQGKRVTVTVSIGAAQRGAKAPAPEDVIKAADKALYKAKKAGRNRVAAG